MVLGRRVVETTRYMLTKCFCSPILRFDVFGEPLLVGEELLFKDSLASCSQLLNEKETFFWSFEKEPPVRQVVASGNDIHVTTSETQKVVKAKNFFILMANGNGERKRTFAYPFSFPTKGFI